MTQRVALPSPVDLPQDYLRGTARVTPDGDVMFVPGCPFPKVGSSEASLPGRSLTLDRPAGCGQGSPGSPIAGPRPLESEAQVDPSAGSARSAEDRGADRPGSLASADPPARGGLILMRLGDVRIGTLIVDSTSRKVLGRVVKWDCKGSKARGKAMRTRILIELEEEQG